MTRTLIATTITVLLAGVLNAQDAARVYVGSCDKDEIFAFSPDGEFLFRFGHEDILGPRGMACSPEGELFVASQRTSDILVFDQDGTYRRKIVPDGVKSAASLEFGPDGHLYVASHGTGEVVVLSGETVVRRFGAYSLTTPAGLAFNEHGEIYVANEQPPRIFRFSPEGHLLADFTCTALATPSSLAISGDRLYAASGAETIVAFDLFGNMAGLIDASHLETVDAVAIDHDGNITASSGTTGDVSIFSPDWTLLGNFESAGMSVARSLAYTSQSTAQSTADVVFLRGDSNGDERVDLSDALATLGFLYLGGSLQSCRDAADANDSGRIEMADAVHVLGYLFNGGTPPSAPYPTIGEDPTADSLICGPVTGS